MSAKTKNDFAPVQAELKSILKKYEGDGLSAVPNMPGDYILIGPRTEHSMGKEVWFGGIRTGKAYVSYHLMAVYVFPDLLEGISPELKKRMQGKSCFNFKKVDQKLFKELAKLTDKGYKRFKKEKWIE